MRNKEKKKIVLIILLFFSLLVLIQPVRVYAAKDEPVGGRATGDEPVGGPAPSQSGCPPGQDTDDGKPFGPANPCKLKNPAKGQLVPIDDFGDLLRRIINIMLMFAGGIAVVFLIIGGFRYVTSQGNEEGMEKAKKTITSAILGIVIIVMAFAIVAIVNNLLTASNYNPPANNNNNSASNP